MNDSSVRTPHHPRWWHWLLLWLGAAAVVLVVLHFALDRPRYLLNLRADAELAKMAPFAPGSRVVIFAPHPDDEVLACGGVLQQAQAAGCAVTVVLMTNGDGSELSLFYAEKTLSHTPDEFLDLGRRRLQESVAGVGVCGLPPGQLVSLGYPNGGLDRLYEPANWLLATPYTSSHTRAFRNPYSTSMVKGGFYCGQQVLSDVTALLQTLNPDVVFAPSPWDVHPDHWATWGFVRLALQIAGWQYNTRHQLYSYLVHRPDWPAPRGCLPEQGLKPPAGLARLRDAGWVGLPLAPDQVNRKLQALNQYRTQAPHWDRLLVSFVRAEELFCLLEDAARPGRPAVVPDPVGDLPGVALAPAGDLSSLRVESEASVRPCLLELVTAPDPALGYVVLGHSSGTRGLDVWEVAVLAGQATLTRAFRGALVREAVPCAVAGRTVLAQLPARLFENGPVLVEGATRRGLRYLDHCRPVLVPVTPSVRPPG